MWCDAGVRPTCRKTAWATRHDDEVEGERRPGGGAWTTVSSGTGWPAGTGHRRKDHEVSRVMHPVGMCPGPSPCHVGKGHAALERGSASLSIWSRDAWCGRNTARWTPEVLQGAYRITDRGFRAQPALGDHVGPVSEGLWSRNRLGFRVERATGIEPASSVWKTETLPLSYARNWCGFRVSAAALERARRPYTWSVRAPGCGAAW
jgi:hypothetical protein